MAQRTVINQQFWRLKTSIMKHVKASSWLHITHSKASYFLTIAILRGVTCNYKFLRTETLHKMTSLVTLKVERLARRRGVPGKRQDGCAPETR